MLCIIFTQYLHPIFYSFSFYDFVILLIRINIFEYNNDFITHLYLYDYKYKYIITLDYISIITN